MAVTGGAVAGIDFSGWWIWWEMNKDPYLRLKDSVHAVVFSGDDDFYLGDGERLTETDYRPSDESVHGHAVPALLATLEHEHNSELIASALIALGKIGPPPADAPAEWRRDLVASLQRFLSHSSTHVREMATAALGILGEDRATFVLADLLANNENGRKIVDDSRVGARLQSFAAYGLGLIGNRTRSEDVRRFVSHKLLLALEEWKGGPKDVPVACINALGITPLAEARESHEDSSFTHCRSAQIRHLVEIFETPRIDRMVRAHLPVALGRLASGISDETLRGLVARTLTKPLGARSGESRETELGCVLGLGHLGDADGDDVDRRIREVLIDASDRTGDSALRHLALISLSRIAARPGPGGDDPLEATSEVAELLTKRLARGRSTSRPWIAMSLGVLGRGLANASSTPPGSAAETLSRALEGTRSQVEVGAYCVGSGLNGDPRVGEAVAAKLERGDDFSRGYAAISLGLMDARRDADTLVEALKGASSRPTLLAQLATGLALLGDKRAVPELVELLAEGTTNERIGASLAISACGDSRSMEPLLKVLEDEQATDLARAFAALALGNVAEKDPIPWRAVYASGVNYPAATVTLTGGEGILDIP